LRDGFQPDGIRTDEGIGAIHVLADVFLVRGGHFKKRSSGHPDQFKALFRSANASKPDMAGGGIDRLTHTSCRSVTLTIIRSAKVGTAFHHFPRNALGIDGIATGPRGLVVRLV
jgi:hypothetical protein